MYSFKGDCVSVREGSQGGCPIGPGVEVAQILSLVEETGSSHHHVMFFFQAEDGIRDYKVTGVQTCALPICIFGLVNSLGEIATAHRYNVLSLCQEFLRNGNGFVKQSARVIAQIQNQHLPHRSEERRVGKECRSRWSPYH